MTKAKQLKVTLKKSLSGRKPTHLGTLRGLGLKRINQSVVVDATPESLGMVNQVHYLVSVEQI